MITVKDLREQLERLEAVGLGDFTLWFRNDDNMDELIHLGVIDNDLENVMIG